MSTFGPRAQPKEKPLLDMDIVEDKAGNLPLVVTLHIVPRSRKSTKAEKDNGKKGSVQGIDCHYCIQCLVPNTTILPCSYNHSQQLERRVDETNTYPMDPIQEKEIYYKKGVKRDSKGRGENPPTHQRHQKRLPELCRGHNPLW